MTDPLQAFANWSRCLLVAVCGVQEVLRPDLAIRGGHDAAHDFGAWVAKTVGVAGNGLLGRADTLRERDVSYTFTLEICGEVHEQNKHHVGVYCQVL